MARWLTSLLPLMSVFACAGRSPPPPSAVPQSELVRCETDGGASRRLTSREDVERALVTVEASTECAQAIRELADATDFQQNQMYMWVGHEAELSPTAYELDPRVVTLVQTAYCGGDPSPPELVVYRLPARPDGVRVRIQGDCGGDDTPAM